MTNLTKGNSISKAASAKKTKITESGDSGKYTSFQKLFIERLKRNHNLGGEDEFQSNADELIGRISEVINMMTTKSDGVESDWEPILQFLIQLQYDINKAKITNSPDPLVTNLFKTELDCLRAFRYVSVAALEIYGICQGDKRGAMNVLWELQELVNFPVLEERGGNL